MGCSQAGGIVLAGGQSRRMGTNKALLKLSSGVTFIEQVISVMKQAVSEILLVTNTPEEYSFLNIPMVEDNYRVGASLAGLEAGLNASIFEYNLVVACDMPNIKVRLLDSLLSFDCNYDALVPMSRAGQKETLCAVYSRSCLPAIRQSLERGDYRMNGWLPEVKTVFVTSDQLQQFDPDLSSFTNLNTPEEYNSFKLP